MPQNIYLGNLPEWVTADDIRSWLDSSDLVCDSIRVIRDFETQASKGYAFLEAPNQEEMESIIQRFNRAPIDGKILRAKTAHPKNDKSSTARSAPRRRRRRRDGADEVNANAGQQQSAPSSDAPKDAKPESVGSFGEALQKAL